MVRVKLSICRRFPFGNHFMPNAHVNDLQKALGLDQIDSYLTRMLNSMVIQYGMSDQFGKFQREHA
jgi:hypothetical protein